MKTKKIGVLGGMGPEASAKFYKEIIEISQKKYSAVQDIDFPPMFIYSCSLEEFNESGVVNEKSVLKQLIHGVGILNEAGADFIAIPCNTVHCFFEELKKHSKALILNIVEETAKKIKSSGLNSVVLLASETTYRLKVYEKIFNKFKINLVIPEDKEKGKITSLILEVMSGNISDKTKNNVLKLIEKIKQDSQAVVLGCTELPIAIKQEDISIGLFDTSKILAESVLNCYHKGLKCKLKK